MSAPSVLEPLWPWIVILVAGWLATDIWRYLGVLAAARLDENGPVFLWVKAVATGLVAGVIARLVLFPTGSLEAVPPALRLAAVALGFTAYWAFRRNVFAGVLVAEIGLVGGAYFLGV